MQKYTKINFVDCIDNNPDSYVLDGKKVVIKKDEEGITQQGTLLTAEILNHIDDGIYENSRGIDYLENKLINLKFPVASVNKKVGDVVLTTEDIKTTSGKTLQKELNEKIDENKFNTKFEEKFSVKEKEIDDKLKNAQREINTGINEMQKAAQSVVTRYEFNSAISNINDRINSAKAEDITTEINQLNEKVKKAFTLGVDTKKDVVRILTSKGEKNLTTESSWDEIKSAIKNLSCGKRIATGKVPKFEFEKTVEICKGIDFEPRFLIARAKESHHLRESTDVISLYIPSMKEFSQAGTQDLMNNGVMLYMYKRDGVYIMGAKPGVYDATWWAIE